MSPAENHSILLAPKTHSQPYKALSETRRQPLGRERRSGPFSDGNAVQVTNYLGQRVEHDYAKEPRIIK